MALHPGEAGYDEQMERREKESLERDAKRACTCDGGGTLCRACRAENKLKEMKKPKTKVKTTAVAVASKQRVYAQADISLDYGEKGKTVTSLAVDTIHLQNNIRNSGTDSGLFMTYLPDDEVTITLKGRYLRGQMVGEKPKPTLPVGVSILITDKHGYVLLGRRKGSDGAGLLSTPGGRLEVEETIPRCAARELQEECGIVTDPANFETIGFKEHFRFGKHTIMFYVHLRYTGQGVCNMEPEKCAGWQWHRMIDIDPKDCTEPPEILARLATILAGW